MNLQVFIQIRHRLFPLRNSFFSKYAAVYLKCDSRVSPYEDRFFYVFLYKIGASSSKMDSKLFFGYNNKNAFPLLGAFLSFTLLS